MVGIHVCLKCEKQIYADLEKCPHCDMSLPKNVIEKVEPTSQPFVRVVRVVLSFGQEIEIREIKLFEQIETDAIRSLEVRAKEKLGDVSTGVGVIGSPGWVAGGVLAITALESVLTKASQKEGLKLLQLAEEKLVRLRNTGEFFPMSEISSAQHPIPTLWAAKSEREVAISERRFMSTKTETTKLQLTYVAGPDPFILVRTTEGKELSIFWEAVQSYEPISSNV